MHKAGGDFIATKAMDICSSQRESQLQPCATSRTSCQQLFAHNFYPERTKFCRSAWYVYSMRRGVTFDLLAEGSTLGVNLQDIFTRLGFRRLDTPQQ